MDSPNSPPLPSISTSENEPFTKDLSPPPTPPTSDYTESEGDKEDSWPSQASEFSKGSSDHLYGDPEEEEAEVASNRVPATSDEGDEDTSEEEASGSGSEEEDEDEDEE